MPTIKPIKEEDEEETSDATEHEDAVPEVRVTQPLRSFFDTSLSAFLGYQAITNNYYS